MRLYSRRSLVLLITILISVTVITVLDNGLVDCASVMVRTAAAFNVPEQADAQASESQAARETDSFISQILGAQNKGEPTQPEGVILVAAKIILRLTLAALLAVILAFRPRKTMRLPLQSNPYLKETQILLAIVGAALMMIVADSAARAFGIFAAASLVRFRTNIRDPKEITVLLLSLGIGLASGVSRFELAIVFTLFSVLVLWILEHYEPAQIFRAMQLKVKTRSVERTAESLREIFERHDFMAEVRELNREDEKEPFGKLVYVVNLGPDIGTDELSEEIFSSDEQNIDSVEWDQKRGTSYIYR